MEKLRGKVPQKTIITKVTTFPVPFALEEIKENISVTTNNPPKHSKEQIINQAIKFHLQSNISAAAKYYQDFINQGFIDHRVFANYGIILKDLGKLQEAEILQRKAIQIKPDFAIAYSNLGTILKDLGKLQEAEISQRKAIELKPDFAEAHSNLGTIFRDLGKLQDAEISFRKAIQIKPNFADSHNNLGNLLNDLGKLQEAEITFRKAIQVKPDFAEAHSNLGNILKDLGKLQEAEISQRKAIELKPDFAEAHSNLGTIFRDLGKLQDAEISFRKAIQIKPNFADSHNNLGNLLNDLGKLQEAEITFRKAIQVKPDFAEAHSNLGTIFRDLGKLQDAEISFKKAIQIKPDFAEAHSNLGTIFRDLGKFQEAEISFRKAIQIKPDLSQTYYYLSTLKYSNDHNTWQEKLFSKNILINRLQKEKVDIYFARSRVLHNEKKYTESSKCLLIANKIKLNLKPSEPDLLINESKELLIESDKNEINYKEYGTSPQSIFIVGMPRSGSTLLESILSMNTSVDDLGEINILEKSFVEWKHGEQGLTLAELYWKRANSLKGKFKIQTNKWLYNYKYVGIIASQIPNAKIVHCFRNPLDNILSIYRAHFISGNEYSSSLVDCSKVYLDQEKTMTEYKNRFRLKIYDFNYDSLVSNPNGEIRSLIDWLGWEWDDSYLSPHLNPRSVSTASSVQVRYPINSKSIGGWKKYRKMLQPAIDLITNTEKYRDVNS